MKNAVMGNALCTLELLLVYDFTTLFRGHPSNQDTLTDPPKGWPD